MTPSMKSVQAQTRQNPIIWRHGGSYKVLALVQELLATNRRGFFFFSLRILLFLKDSHTAKRILVALIGLDILNILKTRHKDGVHGIGRHIWGNTDYDENIIYKILNFYTYQIYYYIMLC